MNEIFSIIQKNVNDENSIFVFSTDIASSSWADYIISNTNIKAVPQEQFIAWDTFKGSAVKSKMQNKTSIPSLLRKLFVTALLDKNIEQTNKDEPIFTSLVTPEFVETSTSFANWIASLLPQLQSWKEKFERKYGDIEKSTFSNQEDKDLFTLYKSYLDFLNKNNLFEPAWEKPPFDSNGKHYYIFYPELLEDFSEYQALLEDAEKNNLVDIIHAPKKSFSDDKLNDVQFFSNTKTELRKMALFINKLHSEQKINYQDIAINVPQIEDIKPYLVQELELNNIPYKMRSGKKLSEYSEGKLFELIKNCYQENFSFASITSLLANAHFPWKEKEVIDQLISFGLKYHCVCSYDNNDIWNETFLSHPKETRANAFYSQFKKSIQNICLSTSFEKIRVHYFEFRNLFFDLEIENQNFDQIIGRCISELSSLIDINNNFPDVVCQKPFDFFINLLNSKDYLPQSNTNGVSVFPYKVACECPFEYHIVIQAGQKALTLEYSQLKFLPKDKRENLNLIDRNVSDLFINSYTTSSTKGAYYSASEKSFSGYVLPYNSFNEINRKSELSESDDSFYLERMFFQNTQQNEFPKTLHSIQKDSFSNWVTTKEKKNLSPEEISEYKQRVQSQISALIHKKLDNPNLNKIQISVSTLTKFFDNPLQWFYDRILKIEEFSMENSIVDDVFLGTLYHEIIRRTLGKYKKANQILPCYSENLPDDFVQLIFTNTSSVINEFPQSCNITTPISQLTKQILLSQENAIKAKLLGFFSAFLGYFENYTVLELEKEIIVNNYSSYYLLGKIDCILLSPNDEITIIDFKTSLLPSKDKDLQLPFYVKIYEEDQKNQGRDICVDAALFFSIHQKKAQVSLGCIQNSITNRQTPTKSNVVFRQELNEKNFSFQNYIDNLDENIQLFLKAIDESSPLFYDDDFSKKTLFCTFADVLTQSFNFPEGSK